MITIEQIHIRLKDAIKQSGLTQAAIAKQLGIGQQTVSEYIRGKSMPALDTLANLCKIIDVSPAYILYFEEDESGTKKY